MSDLCNLNGLMVRNQDNLNLLCLGLAATTCLCSLDHPIGGLSWVLF
jgi:hypothetical protein